MRMLLAFSIAVMLLSLCSCGPVGIVPMLAALAGGSGGGDGGPPVTVNDTIYVATTGSDTTGNGTSSNPFASLQKGLDEAVSGTTVLVLDGTYTGATNRSLDFKGKDIYLKSSGGAANCIIDCDYSDRAFYFHSGETDAAIVKGFTIQNGYTLDENGGGILCENASSPTITNCVIANCETETGGGGGIHCQDNSNPIIASCIISNNLSGLSGGGIRCVQSSPEITNCIIADNSVTTFHGGGICFVNSSVTLTNCTIANNQADWGAGIYCGNATATLNNTIV